MKTISILILLMQPIFCIGEEKTVFKIAGKETVFYSNEKTRVLSTIKCEFSESENKCPELSFLKEITLKKAGMIGTGGINPGSVICRKLLNGSVLIGFDKKNNENTFCKLKTGLYIDDGTLMYYGLKNQGDIKSQNRAGK